ncbi:MAG: hypothetical protein AAF962_02510 [Actinomycetota bacterium]
MTTPTLTPTPSSAPALAGNGHRPIVPVSVGIDRSRRRRSRMATALVVALVVGPLGIVGWRAAAIASTSASVASAGPGPVDALALPALALSLVVGVRVLRLRRAPRRVRLLPTVVQRSVSDLVELSVFGTGALRGWTIALPTTDLGRLVRPEPLPEIDPRGPSPEPGSMAGGPRPRPRRPPQTSAVSARPRPVGPTRPHIVARGDTWWTLAADTLGDGRRWRTLVELNLGRPVAPGITIGADSALRRGWEIDLPTNPEEGTDP